MELLRLHKGIEEGSDSLLSELGISHTNESVKFSVENAVLNDHTKGPVGHCKLILHVVWTSEHDLISNEIAANFSATEADANPTLLTLRRLFEIR